MMAKIVSAIIGALTKKSLLLRCVILAGLICVIVTAVAAITFKGTTVARFFIAFKFPRVDEDRYPNGIPFSIAQITQPAVVMDLYNRLGLAKRGLSLEEVTNGIYARPYMSMLEEELERQRRALADRRLSASEREKIEKQFQIDLEKTSKRAAEIVFDVSRHVPLTFATANEIVARVPERWAALMIDHYGVMRSPVSATSDSFLGAPPTDVRLATIALAMTMDRLDSRIQTIAAVPEASLVSDPVNKFGLDDYARGIDDLRISLVLLEDKMAKASGATDATGPKTTGSELIRQLGALFSQANSLDASAAMLQKSIEAINAEVVEYVKAAGSAQPGGTGVQVTEGFVDRITQLAGANQQLEFLRSLHTAQNADHRKAIDLRAERRSLVTNLYYQFARELERTSPGTRTLQPALQADVANVFNKANALWLGMNRIARAVDAQRYGEISQLYSPIVTRNMGASFTHPVLTVAYAVFSGGLFVVLVLLFLTPEFVRRIRSRPVRVDGPGPT